MMRDIDRLCDLLERVSGIVTPQREMERLASLAEKRAVASGQGSLSRYIRYLADGGDSDEWRALLGHITINESYLFRGQQQMATLAGTVIPRLMAERPSGRLRVWSAGCARGEEAATLAIVLAEALGLENSRWQILATDLDEDSLAEARKGVFGARAVARVTPELLKRYFTRAGNRFELAPELKERIGYRTLNLVTPSVTPPEAPFDLVFLRNVLIYFRPAAQRRVVETVANTLAPDGVVFVGPSESIWQLRSVLQPEDLGSCFCYRLGSRGPGAGGRGLGDPAWKSGLGEGWFRPEVTPGERSQTPGASRPLPGVAEPPDGREVASQVAASIQGGERQAAMARVTEACRRSPDDPVLRAIEGRVHEVAGELERAVAAYRAALYLEPALCEVRFLMAECLYRLGRRGRAGRELRAVLAALAARTCFSLPAMDPLGRPSRDHMEWRAREMLGMHS